MASKKKTKATKQSKQEVIPIEELVEKARALRQEKEQDAAQQKDKPSPSAAQTTHPEDTNPDDAVALYLEEVSKVPLLSHDEEIWLSKRIEAGREARSALASQDLSDEQRKELLLLVEDGWAAREHLITANFRLVISVAKKYVGRGVTFLDLIQEGNVGLIRATKKFDYRRGHRFSTYATWWIRQAISRGVADSGRTIRLPVHMGDQINRLNRSRHKLIQDFGREPKAHELAEVLDITTDKVEELQRVAQRPISLELPADDDENHEIGDYTPDTETPAPDDSVTQKMMREHLHEMLENIPPREARILQLRYGLMDSEPHTLGEVGKKMGVTRERVRQIEAQALRRLRQPRVRRELQDYLQN